MCVHLRCLPFSATRRPPWVECLTCFLEVWGAGWVGRSVLSVGKSFKSYSFLKTECQSQPGALCELCCSEWL